MKRLSKLIFTALLLSACTATKAQRFDDYFTDNTLRLDYIFAGDTSHQAIYVDELNVIPRWYGRRDRLAELPLKGNGVITVRDRKSQRTIYRHSFSTLFQEWLATKEAKQTQKSFQNVFLVPYPRHDADITVELHDYHGNITATMTHSVCPEDILIRHLGE